MEISQERLDLALKHLRPSDWERFERLASTFLASEFPGIRTMASAGGDGGRDSELFAPGGKANVVIQYSVTQDWSDKIRGTVKRLKETFPDSHVLIFMSNQQIGAKADKLKEELSGQAIFLDIRDRSWFVERTNLDGNRSAAAAELARVIVDPYLESRSIIDRTVSPLAGSPLAGQEARTALFFLEMQWRDENLSKGLTKSAFETLVRAALHGTSPLTRVTRSQIHTRVHEFLPQYSFSQLVPFIDAALRRLNKKAVRHVQKDDEFSLSYEETEKVKDRAAAISLLNDAFEADVFDIAGAGGVQTEEKLKLIATLAHNIIERYFLRRGEEFAASLARDADPPLDAADLKTIAIEVAPSEELVKNRENVQFLLHVVTTLMTNPSDSTREYLRVLSDSYTLFAFLEEVPDVQKVTKKLFTHGEIWLDTSVLLPVFAEQAFPRDMRPFTNLFEQAKAAKLKLYVTSGILEEIERHLNLCEVFNRTDNWEGRVPYVFSRYVVSGKSTDGFAGWCEQFRGKYQPVQDIAEYLSETFAIEVLSPVISDSLDSAVLSAVREYWQGVQDKRRSSGGGFSINAYRLAEHDAENCISVLSERHLRSGKAPLGYTSWLLTLDSAARKMLLQLDREIANEIKHSIVISVDFLMKYLAFGPNRDRVHDSAGRLPYVFASPFLEIPKELLAIAQHTRSESGKMPERIIQRRIREELDRQKSKAGVVQIAGLDAAYEAINEMF